MTSDLLRKLLVALALVLLLPASECIPVGDDDDDAADDDDVADDDDAADDDDMTPPVDTVISGEVIAIDQATNVVLTDAEFDGRANGLIVYVLPDANDLSNILAKVTMDGPGEYDVLLEDYVGPVDVIAVADFNKNGFIDSGDVARQYAYNPLAATGDDLEEVNVYLDIGPHGGGGVCGNGCGGDCSLTNLSGEATIVDLPDGDVGISANAGDLSWGPFYGRYTTRYGSGPWDLNVCDDRGMTALVGYLDADDNGYFEPSDPTGGAGGNPFTLGIGDVTGIQIDIPGAEDIDLPVLPAYVPLSGTVTYDSFTTGDIIVHATHVTTTGVVFSSATLAAPGAFSIIAPSGTDDVLVWAVLDSDGDGTFDISTDPFAAQNLANTGSGVSGIALDLGDVENGSISGSISLGGAVGSGDVLHVAVFDTPTYDPAEGPPVDFIEAVDPTFPYAFGFTDLEPGTYYIGGYLDIGADNPTGAGPEDPGNQVGPILLAPAANAGGVSLELTVED